MCVFKALLKRLLPCLATLVLVMRCSNPYDAKQVAEAYCQCIESTTARHGYDRALTFCNKEFAKKNRYFRAYYYGTDEIKTVPQRKEELAFTHSPEDSFHIFRNRFLDYVDKSCSSLLKSKTDSSDHKFSIPHHAEFRFMRGIRTCEEAESLASEGAMGGDYKIITWGLPDESEFSRYYESYVKDKYGITIIHGGCLSYKIPDCYDAKMRQLIWNKLGSSDSNFLYNEARTAFRQEQSKRDDK